MINDAFEFDRHHANEVPIISNADVNLEKDVMSNVTQEGHKAREYYYLTRDGEQPLYEGCTKYSRFSFLAKLYYIKCLCGISDKAMTMILELLRDAGLAIGLVDVKVAAIDATWSGLKLVYRLKDRQSRRTGSLMGRKKPGFNGSLEVFDL